VREITDRDELTRLCGGDALCRWAARDLRDGVRAFTHGAPGATAVAVASPALSRRDRIVVHGAASAAVPLVREVLGLVGPGYRPLGARELLRAVAAALPGHAAMADFGWMDRTAPRDGGPAGRREPLPQGVGWLPSACAAEVDALLEDAFPGAYARARDPEDVRWAGARAGDGTLCAVAALAWSAPDVGFLTGVAVRPGLRGRGLARRVCGYVAEWALARHGTAALIVDDVNTAAVRCYRAIGFTYRPLAVAVPAV
jgi:GNAT superfamily N-acetyltransferase